jgi:carboxyl-terminal processing protease
MRAAFAAGLMALLLLGQTGSAPAAEKQAYVQLNLFGDVFELVRSQYVTDVDEIQLMYAALRGMLAGLDPHSDFMDGETYREMQERTSGQFGGLGIEVRMEEGAGVRVVRPMEDTPAFRAGVLPGDLITHLDGAPIMDFTLTEAVDMMRGLVNSTLVLTIAREGAADPLVITLTRAVIRQPSVTYRVEDSAAYIRISTFSEQTESGVRRGMAELKEELGDAFEGVILDLRDNPGGLLDQSIAATEAFLDRGEVVMTRGRDQRNVQRFTARRGDLADGKPVIVLINGGSASASEIVAGALQDHRRAIIVGTQSFGKGSVQTIMPLGEFGAMRLTTQRYYTPSGRSIQGTGISPDVVVEQAVIEPLYPAPPARGEDGQIVVADEVFVDYQLSRARELIHAMAVYQRSVAAMN